VRAWVEMNDEGLEPEILNQRLISWFGSQDKKEAEHTGDFIFFDALPDKPPLLACDIMTPHMDEWYSKGDELEHGSKNIPADWHEPVPIPFLVTKNIKLVFHIAPRTAANKEQLNEVLTALTDALEYLGAGAKTSSGYGYFSVSKGFKEHLQAEQVKIEQAEAEAQHLASLSPFELSLEEFLKSFPEDEHDTRLLKALTESKWQGEDAKVVAKKIQGLMEATNKWIPEFTGTNKKKIKLKDRSLQVQSYLEG